MTRIYGDMLLEAAISFLTILLYTGYVINNRPESFTKRATYENLRLSLRYLS